MKRRMFFASLAVLAVTGLLALVLFVLPDPAGFPDALPENMSEEDRALLEEEPLFAGFLSGTGQVLIDRLDPIATKDGDIRPYQVNSSRGYARAFIFPEGSVFWCETSRIPFTLSLDCGAGASAVRLDPGDERSPLLVQSGPGGLGMLVEAPLGAVIDGTPNDPFGITAVEERNGTASLRRNSVTLEFDRPKDEGHVSSVWWVYASEGAFPADEDVPQWLYDCEVDKLGADDRMAPSGYYRTSPEDYSPSGDGCFYLDPAASTPVDIARRCDDPDALRIAAAMLDIQRGDLELSTLSELVDSPDAVRYLTFEYPDIIPPELLGGTFDESSEAGFIPTAPRSEQLQHDYSVGAGFHDARANTDLAAGLLALGEKLGADTFDESAENYVLYLCFHALTRSDETANGGLLVDDYSHPDGSKRTHCALNDQLAETLLLYSSGIPEAEDVARRMLLGIEDTAEDWVRPGGGLYCARFPDGSYSGSAPDSAYTDLLALDRYLGGSAALARLADAQREWMDANGVTAEDQ